MKDVTQKLGKVQRMIPYRDRPGAYILVAEIEDPYGPGTDTIVSIGCTLKNRVDNPLWKVHIPMELVPELVSVLGEVGK